MKFCPICRKKSLVGGAYSNRIRATKFNPTGKVRKQPNLQWARLPSGGRVRICASCLKAGKQFQLKTT